MDANAVLARNLLNTAIISNPACCPTGQVIYLITYHMRFRLLIGLCWVAALSTAGADEKLSMLSVGGTVYSNVTITAVYATDIFFTYNHGLANAKLKDLDPDLQRRFQYDPTLAKQVEKKRVEANVQYQQKLINDQARAAAVKDETRLKSTPPPTASGNIIWAKTLLGQKAPGLEVEKWLTSEPDCRGKFMLINFWATWCPPCNGFISQLNDFHKKFGDKLVVIGLSDESESTVRHLTSPGIQYYSAIDTQARMKNAVGVTGVPHVLVIDPHGIVRWEGYPFVSGYNLDEKILAGILTQYSK
jgi:cytochrome c biogenesis protein CcmG, thiol:disulfide interchange protein DsbE